MKSIMHDGKRCYLCGSDRNLDWHHVFGGANRKWSEKYGLTVRLCHHSCHIFGPYSAHKCKEVSDSLKRKGQEAFEKTHSHEEFMRVFGRNYL